MCSVFVCISFSIFFFFSSISRPFCEGKKENLKNERNNEGKTMLIFLKFSQLEFINFAK